MLDLSRSLEDEAALFVRKLQRQTTAKRAKVNSVSVDAYGQAHVRGGIFNATGGRDAHLSMHGLTRGDVTAFRERVQERLGFAPPVAMAEALLIQTHNAPACATLAGMEQEAQRERERVKKQRRREWARANGRCIICCKNPATMKRDGTIGSTCWECQRTANAAKRKA